MIELNKIYNADCLEFLPELADKSIDCLITDPPYSIGTTSTGTRGNFIDNNLIKPFFEIWIKEIRRCLKDTADFYINTDWRTYSFLYPIVASKMRVTNCIVWDYEWIKAGSHYRFSHEFIIFGNKLEGQKRKFSASERDVWRIKPINFTDTENKFHQAQKPLALIKKMLCNSTKEGNTVLDTFGGSGSTACACADLKRNFIVTEIDQDIFDMSVKRYEEHIKQTRLAL